MKIAIVHNDYGKFSGEEAVVRDHATVLRQHGHEVVEFRRSSAELTGLGGRLKAFLAGIYNPFSRRRFAEFLERERPDVVHIHNLYPLINPCVLPEATDRGIPVVMTVHNYRLFCPDGLFATHGRICEDCARLRSVRPCLRQNCLSSRFKSLGYALRNWMAWKRRWYPEHVSRFLCLTDFQRGKLVEYGIPAAKCRTVPNFIDPAWQERAEAASPGAAGYVAYMGRLSEEKGIDLLLQAARRLPEIPFKLAGSGAEAYREKTPPNVEFVGYLTGDAQFDFMRNARIHMMCSRWYECFPTSLLQGMALGVPSLVPNLGGMPEIIRGAGEAFELDQMAEAVKSLFHDRGRLERYRAGALRRIADFSPERFMSLIEGIYAS